MTKKNKTYYLTLKKPNSPPHPLHLILTPPKKRGECWKCHLDKEICVISERPIGLSWEIKNFCQPCAWFNLNELAESNFEFENKAQIIKEIRKALAKSETLLPPEKENWLECYG